MSKFPVATLKIATRNLSMGGVLCVLHLIKAKVLLESMNGGPTRDILV
jgi:hypothetical protein